MPMRTIRWLLGLVLACVLTSSAHAGFFYWDANGSDPGAGGPTPTGTWGVDAYWNSSYDGTNSTQPWNSVGTAVFSAGNDATGTFTVNVSGTQTGVVGLAFNTGTVTLQGGSLQMTMPTFGFAIPGISAPSGITAILNTTLTINPSITNILKFDMGTIILGTNNNYTCPTTIEGGTVQLGTSNAILPGYELILANGGTGGLVDTPATLNAAGFSQTFGSLMLTGPNPAIHRTLDFGNGNSALVFGDSSTNDWNGIPLWITNYTAGVDSLRFGTNSSGLTPTQLGLIRFADFYDVLGQIDVDGFVTPNFAPQVLSMANDSGSDFIVTWTSVPNRTYRLQYKDDLGSAIWADVGDFPATGTTTSASNNSNGTQRFYRVVLLP